jgi:hypothetical protein
MLRPLNLEKYKFETVYIALFLYYCYLKFTYIKILEFNKKFNKFNLRENALV